MSFAREDVKKKFINRFAASFLACYAAQNYSEWCSLDQHDRFDNLPVEDAVDIAKKAWKKAKPLLTTILE